MKMYGKFALIILTALALGLVQLHTVGAEETFIWGANVYSDGTLVTSPMLEAGRQYRIVAKEIFWYNYASWLAADAQYYTTGSNSWNWVNYFPAPDGHSFLQINGMDVNWGPFSNGDTGHTYTIYYTGTGAPVTFQIIDWIDGDCSNNHCHLPVEIYALPPPTYYGCTPGFWKNHLDVWPQSYSPSGMLQSVFGECAPDVTLYAALRLKGGSGLVGAKQILARAAVAALLNAETFGASYKYSPSELIESVSYQFCYGTRASILSLASDLDYWNNMGCPCWS